MCIVCYDHFIVVIIDMVNQQFVLLSPNFATNLLCWTVNVAASVNEDRETSIRRLSQHFGMCYSATWEIIRVDLGFKAYKIRLM